MSRCFFKACLGACLRVTSLAKTCPLSKVVLVNYALTFLTSCAIWAKLWPIVLYVITNCCVVLLMKIVDTQIYRTTEVKVTFGSRELTLQACSIIFCYFSIGIPYIAVLFFKFLYIYFAFFANNINNLFNWKVIFLCFFFSLF